MIINSFKHNDWTKIYDGRWSFLTSTHFIRQYNKEIIFGGRPFMSQSIIFTSSGRSSGWMKQSDRDRLGKYLSAQISKNPKHAKVVVSNLKNQAKDFLRFINKNENTVATLSLYKEFWKRLLAYYQPHINVKYVVDYLSPDLLKKHLPVLQAARLVAEPVLNRTEDFMIGFAKILSKRTQYDHKLLMCLTKEELIAYFLKGELPKKSGLASRNQKAALVGDKGGYAFFTGNSIKKIERLVNNRQSQSELKGASAYNGKIIGRAQIVLDPKKAKGFKTGDILITGATRPEFLPLMHKAAGFVTDAGGILSHAAITAREMKKPCVIATQIATKTFKNGDIIEVDANTGVIKKIK